MHPSFFVVVQKCYGVSHSNSDYFRSFLLIFVSNWPKNIKACDIRYVGWWRDAEKSTFLLSDCYGSFWHFDPSASLIVFQSILCTMFFLKSFSRMYAPAVCNKTYMIKLIFEMYYWMVGRAKEKSFLFQQLNDLVVCAPHSPDIVLLF